MTTNQKKEFLIEVLFGLFIVAVLFLLYKFILPITLPFLIGLLVAWIVVMITNKLNIHNKWARIGIVILVYVLLVLFILIVLSGIATWFGEKIILLPDLVQNTIIPMAREWHYDVLHPIVESLDPSIHTLLSNIWDNLVASLMSLASGVTETAVTFASNTLASIPSTFISFLMMLVSTFFFVVDYEKMVEFYNKYTPLKVKDKIELIKMYLKDTLLVVTRSYVIICTLTFTELSVLFSVFGIPHAIPLAFLIAIFDIMPVLGTGGILIPWSVIAFVMGNPLMGAKILIIYIIVTAIRNYVEPKIVGVQLGLHPIVTLVSMFIGLQLFGFIGMFGFPIMISFIWKNRKVEE